MNNKRLMNNSGMSLIQVLMSVAVLSIGIAGLNTQMKNISDSGNRIKKKIGFLKKIRSISEFIKRDDNCNAFLSFNDVDNISVGNKNAIPTISVGGTTLLELKNYNDYRVVGIDLFKVNSQHLEVQIRSVSERSGTGDSERSGTGDKEIIDLVNIYLKKDINNNTLCQDVEGAVSDAILSKVCTGPGAYILNGRCMKVGIGHYGQATCPGGKIIKKSIYNSDSGVYESVCRSVSGKEIKHLMLDNPVGNYCKVEDLSISNSFGRVSLKCNSGGSTTLPPPACNDEGDPCGTGCCSNLTCNTSSNVCEASVSTPPVIDAQLCCHQSESGGYCDTDVGPPQRCWIYCRNQDTDINLEECGQTRTTNWTYKKDVACHTLLKEH